jgi:hypothetical protein
VSGKQPLWVSVRLASGRPTVGQPTWGEETKNFIRTIPLSSKCSPSLSPRTRRTQAFGSDASTTPWMVSINAQERKNTPSSREAQENTHLVQPLLSARISLERVCLQKLTYRSYCCNECMHAFSSSLDETFKDIHATGICYHAINLKSFPRCGCCSKCVSKQQF